VLDTLPAAGAAASLLVMGTTLWVASASPSAPHLLDTATGKLLASNWTAQQQSVCDLLAPQHAVCTVGGSRGAALHVTTVYDTSALPPRPLWTNYMAAQLIAADAGQLVAQTGLAPGALVLSGFALDTGALAWSLPAPWVGFGLAAGGAALAYDDAGTLWAAWLGFDETQQYSAIVATYNIAAVGGAAQIANVSVSVAGTLDAVQGLVISNNGRLGYLTLTDAASGATSVLTLRTSPSELSFAGTAFTVPATTRLQAVPGPQDGQLIIGQLSAAGQPSMAVYA
jgi:hypothetical protein